MKKPKVVRTSGSLFAPSAAGYLPPIPEDRLDLC